MKKAGVEKLDVKKVRTGLAALLAVTALILGAIALFDGGSGDSSSSSTGSGSEGESIAVALSESELLAQVSSLGLPAFWVGPRAGTSSYELSTPPDGRVYIRYLTGDAEAGDPHPDFLTVGTYPVPEAKKALEEATRAGEGGQTLSQEEGYKVLASPEATNAYVVFDNQPDAQVEIFSPQPGEAAELAKSGTLKPVE